MSSEASAGRFVSWTDRRRYIAVALASAHLPVMCFNVCRRDGGGGEAADPSGAIVSLALLQPAVDDVADAREGNRRLCDIRGNHYAPRGVDGEGKER